MYNKREKKRVSRETKYIIENVIKRLGASCEYNDWDDCIRLANQIKFLIVGDYL